MSRILYASLLPVVLAFGFWGCNHDNAVSSAAADPQLVSVSPANGATDVPTTQAITMKFNTPMDPYSVTSDFHCAGGEEMHKWMDALQHPAHQHPMTDQEMDHMMQWMHDIESPGTFEWSHNMMVCTFHPRGGLSPDTDYMIYFGEGARSQGGGMMNMRHMQHIQNDAVMVHFRTGA